uniref:Uncharacterized protein n=1 Tax=Rhizophora mucronata TaxID=61149 RepID=A0A2P2JC54_RHIMU
MMAIYLMKRCHGNYLGHCFTKRMLFLCQTNFTLQFSLTRKQCCVFCGILTHIVKGNHHYA